jgi:PHD/YefM family antitoxin component YafN of YafNO toxin-antitoxin module
MANLAKFAMMTRATDTHDLRPSEALPTSPASRLKNAFKPVFQQALQEGAISITRNNKREAILLSANLYDRIVAELAAHDPLEILRKDYDKRFGAMQTKAAQNRYEDAFNAAPEVLGQAAVDQAKG